MNHFEPLENRRLMTAAITDMTVLAQQHAVHASVTDLYLNFSGGTITDAQAGGSRTISAFQPGAGQDRQQAMQDILYQVSEIFAPFNVHVQVLSGASQYSQSNGNTTIFVGDNAANVNAAGSNETYSDTPANSMDYPTPHKGPTHALNSDTYDLAFVDPVSLVANLDMTTETDGKIASDIAHEAGHTFGLAHVLSQVNGVTTDDIMSYDSPDQYFANDTFQITNLNNNGTTQGPDASVVPTLSTGAVTTQNSYTCLKALLGATTFYGTAYYENHVADTTRVDPAYSSNIATMSPIMSLQLNATNSGAVVNSDYDVYSFTNTSTAPQAYTINLVTRGALSPQVFVYDSTGTKLITSFTGKAGRFTAEGNSKIVIGSYNGGSSGDYGISLVPINHVMNNGGMKMIPPLTSAFSNTPITDSAMQDDLTA